MRQIEVILEVLRSLTSAKNDVELTEILGIPYASLNTWKTRDAIPAKRLLEFSQKLGVSMDDLIKGNTSINYGDNNIAVSGSNNSISLKEHMNSDKFNEFLELYKKYGNDAMLDSFIEKLNKVKEILDA